MDRRRSFWSELFCVVYGITLCFSALLVGACSSSEEDERWVDIPTDVYSQTTTDSGEKDTAVPAVILEEGEWGMSEPQVISDVCGVDSCQDVLEFVPKTMLITNVTDLGFDLDEDDFCAIEDLAFSCHQQQLEESVLSGTATMMIESTLSGDVENANLVNTFMDVTITDCEGAGCALIELALTFPCPIQLNAKAVLL